MQTMVNMWRCLSVKKPKNHQGGLGDKADESDPKMLSTGMSNCPVKYFKKVLSILNPNQTALFQKPKRNFLPSDEIWFENSPIGVNKLCLLYTSPSPRDA